MVTKIEWPEYESKLICFCQSGIYFRFVAKLMIKVISCKDFRPSVRDVLLLAKIQLEWYNNERFVIEFHKYIVYLRQFLVFWNNKDS